MSSIWTQLSECLQQKLEKAQSLVISMAIPVIPTFILDYDKSRT